MAECSFEDCGYLARARNLCSGHYKQSKQGKWPQYSQQAARRNGQKYGNPRSTLNRSDGYAYCYYPEHPGAKIDGRIAHHRLVIEEVLGRYLAPGENVHHINGVRDDNRPENLELWNTTQPAGQRVDDKVRFALEILHLYRPDLLKETP